MTSILQIADVHFGAEDAEALRAVREVEEELAPDLVLLCGDVTQTGSTHEFVAARDWLAGFSAPVVAMPGNHDAPYYSPLSRVLSPYGRFEKYVRTLCVDSYADAHVHVLPYNSSRAFQAKLDWSTGVVDLEALAELIGQFEAGNAAGKLSLLALHHPLVYPPESPLDKTTKNGPEALRMLSDANCDAVLTGHIHIPFVKDREPGQTGLLSIGAGTLSTRRRGVSPSFNHIEVDAEGMRVTAVDFEGGELRRRASWSKGREAFA